MNDNPPAPSMEGYAPKAMYFEESDCVEYVREDVPCVYRRIDGFLTLILDLESRVPLGFQLKGFKNFYLTRVRWSHPNASFLQLVEVLKLALTQIGNDVFVSQDRAESYERALHIADEDGAELPVLLMAGSSR